MTETASQLAKKVHIYSNGDRFFTGRRFVINPRQTRNYDSFLTQVTQSLQPAFGAVRVLRTPENGHPVGDLTDLETGRSYVACAQKFVKLGYEDITTKPKQAPSPERRNKFVVSGRIRKIERTPIAVFVYTNGQVLEQPKRILLKPWVQKTWETVLVAINEKISNLRSGAVRHLIDFVSKEEVTEGVHLKNNEYYVAVGSEKFKDLEYGTQTEILSPKQQQKRRYPALRPVKKKNKSDNTSDESLGSSPLEASTNSTESTGKKAGEPPARGKKKVAQNNNNNEEGIPIKPIKHKRGSSDKAKESAAPPPQEPKEKVPETKKQPAPSRQKEPAKKSNKSTIDLDKDEGGVFKSKGKKQKATEVREDNNVKEEVPIDKRKAEVVEDDEDQSSPRKKEPLPPAAKSKNKPEPQRKPPAKKQPAKSSPKNQDAEEEKKREKAATVIQANYRGYRTRKQLKQKKIEQEGKTAETKPESNDSDRDNTDNNVEDERERAAIKIQATYRGYKTRRDLKNADTKNDADKGEDSEKDNDKEREQAATKIQATYRGYKTRKDLRKADKPEEDDYSEEKAEQLLSGLGTKVNTLPDSKEARAPSSQSFTDG